MLREPFSKVRAVVGSSSLLTIGSIGLFVASTVVNIASFGFHLVVSRELEPDAYGALGALVGLLFVFTVPSGALQVAITREVAARRSDPDAAPLPIAVGPLLANSVVFGILSTLVLLAAVPLLQSFLHLPSATAAILLALYVLPITLELVPKAVLLGEFRFGRVAVALVAGAVVRLLIAYPLTSWRGVDGAMAATVLGVLVTPAILLPALRNLLAEQEGTHPLRVMWRDGIGAMVAFSGYWFLVTIDTVMARHFIPSRESGLYAAASLAARSVMFLPGAVAMIAFPRFAAGRGRTVEARRALVHAVAIVTAIGVASALVLIAVPDLVMGTLFPDSYANSGAVLGMLALSAAALGTASVLMHFLLAARSRIGASLPWIAVIAIAIATTFLHDSITQIAVVTLTVNLLLLAVMTIPILGTRAAPRAQYFGRELWDLPDADRDLTMVVPFYNPGALLRTNIEGLIETLGRSGATFEIIAVSDGSTDKSDEGLEDLGPQVRVVRLERNSGKGEALRTGLAMGRGKYVGFIDADGDVAPDQLPAFLALIRLYEPDVILGSKRHPMSELHYPWIRRVYSWGYQQLVRIMFHLNLRDTQTGLKMIRREALAQILPRMVEKRFAFDLELFVVGRHLGFKKYFEAPITIRHQFTSTVSWRSVRGTLLDTLAIYYRLHVLRFYDESPAAGRSAKTGVSSPAVKTDAEAPQSAVNTGPAD